MIVHDCEQNSEKWLRLRLGIPTASQFGKIITPKTAKLSGQSKDLMHWLLAEWIYGAPLDNPETQWMQRGHELEGQAVQSYEFETGLSAAKVGFISSDDGMIGASPDRLVGDAGILEIKCPAPHTHVGYMVTRSVDQDYWPQVQGQMWVAERQWVDIQSYCPGLPAVIIRVSRDEEYIGKLAEAVRSFVDVMLNVRAQLEQRYGTFERRAPKVRDDGPFGITDEDLDVILASRA